MESRPLRIAAFGGFRTIPPQAGGAGSDKFAVELYPRIVAKGHELIAYTRIYPDFKEEPSKSYQGIQLKAFKTVNQAGFDTLLHSFKATFDIILHNRAKYIHLHSGANSIWAIPLRLSGKKVIITQFAMDWKRDKWPWYGKLFYLLSNFLTAHVPNHVIFDNVFTKEYFEKKYKKKFDFIPYGSEVPQPKSDTSILKTLGLTKNEYFLFVGRFIPDKGLHLLIEAFEKINTTKKLLIIGGSPNPSPYEQKIKNTNDQRIIFPGYIYGDETNVIMQNAYAYIQPSLIEGLSPVILTVMGLGTPLICSNIKENLFITKENSITFESGNSLSLKNSIEFALLNQQQLSINASRGQENILDRFNWNKIADQYIEILKK